MQRPGQVGLGREAGKRCIGVEKELAMSDTMRKRRKRRWNGQYVIVDDGSGWVRAPRYGQSRWDGRGVSSVSDISMISQIRSQRG